MRSSPGEFLLAESQKSEAFFIPCEIEILTEKIREDAIRPAGRCIARMVLNFVIKEE